MTRLVASDPELTALRVAPEACGVGVAPGACAPGVAREAPGTEEPQAPGAGGPQAPGAEAPEAPGAGGAPRSRLRWAAAAAGRLARPLALGAANLLYPPQCTWCRSEVQEAHALCPACWREATFIAHPLCDRCGSPMSGAEDAPFCDHCLGRRLEFARARAAVLYEGVGRDLTLALKHGDRLDIARPAATWMIRAGRELLDRADVIAPVPLHWRRLLRRRFNQSAELARRVSMRTGVPCCADLLARTRATPMQRGLSREARAANQAGAFAVPARRRARVEGTAVLLIDDVYASGATLSACAAALRAAGARRVDALCLARVAPEADGPIFSPLESEGSE
ncbi:ComF family protein [uncultured Albimonas sp.]|uniref:ComF family protein n=1 Tax=uncultured Albimonas sp. TaxID=1331701 RepID=UPI0030EDB903